MAEVLARFCRACGHGVDAGVRVCQQCGGTDFLSIPADEDARLVFWTIIRRPAAGFASNGPIVVAVARLPAGDLAIGNLVAPPDALDVLATGQPVSTSLAEDGRLLFSLAAA